MKKPFKYLLFAGLTFLLGYNSIYITKLSEVKKKGNQTFDAETFAKKLWSDRVPSKIDSAIDINILRDAVNADKAAALEKYTNALGIGNYRYALIKARATVLSVNEDEVLIQIAGATPSLEAILATEYIYGNAIRDASGLVEVIDYPNTTELNSISEELNKIVRTSVLPSFKSSVKKEDKLIITAAIELNKEHINWNKLELLPLQLKIVN